MSNKKITSDLIQRAKKNDQEAFTEIVRLTQKRAYFIAYSDLRNKEYAEDVLQEAYSATFRMLGSLKDNDNFEAWFQRILKNKIIDSTKKRTVKEDKQTSTFSSLSDEEIDILPWLKPWDSLEAERILSPFCGSHILKSRT